MSQREVCVFSVSPAASLVSRCVSRGVVSQEEIDSASSSLSPALSSDLRRAEQRIRSHKLLDEVRLEAELLQVDKTCADVTHARPLAARLHLFQMWCDHLQQLLRDVSALRLRLSRPLGGAHLGLHTHLHRCVCEVVQMSLDLVLTLDQKLDSVQSSNTTKEQLDHMNSSLAQMLAQGAELHNLANQVFQWKNLTSDLHPQ